MSENNIDLTGKTFGYLKVLGLKSKSKKGMSWLCKCICGKEVVCGTSRLLAAKGAQKSCGCKAKKQNGNSIKHKRIYRIWCDMKSRCYSPNDSSFNRYGAKGVTVCDEWINSFLLFLEWSLNNGYTNKLTIDRIDSKKPYSPSNCRWSNYFVQAINKGMNKNNTTGFKGVTYSKNIGYRAFITRLNKRKYLGCFKTLEEAVNARKDAEKEFKIKGML